MVSFTTKHIEARPSVGQCLATRRSELGKTIAELARQCNISSRYLLALEEGEYQQLPGDVYAKSFLRSYASILGLPAEELVRQYTSERVIYKKTRGQDHHEFDRPVEKISWIHLLATPKLIRVSGVIGLAVIVTLYLGVKVQGIVSAPRLSVHEPAADVVVGETAIEVMGTTERGTSLTINGQPVVADENGNFSESLDLQHGMNTIEVVAKKKHSQSAVVQRHVVVDPVEPTTDQATVQITNF